MFITGGLFDLISNVTAGDCPPVSNIGENQYCSDDYATILTIANKRDHHSLVTAHMAFTLLTVIAIVFYFHYMRYRFRKIEAVEDLEYTPSDYTLRIDGIKDDEDNKTLASYIQ